MKFKVLFFLLFISVSVMAQEVPITFEQAVGRLGKNPALEASGYEWEAANKERKAAKSLRSPQIGLIANYTLMQKDIKIDINDMKPGAKQALGGLFPQLGTNPIIGGLFAADWAATIQEKNFGFVAATLKMPIYMGGKINAAYNFSKLQLQEVEQKHVQINGELFSELVERYFGLALAYKVIDVRKEVEEGMEHHFSDAVELERNGIVAKGERLYAEMYYSKAKTEYQKSIRDCETINYALCNTLSDSVIFVPQTELFIGANLSDVAYYKELARANNPKLQQVRIKEEMAREGVKAARSEFIPHLSAIGGVNAYSNNVTDILPTAAVGVNLTFNIFNGLNREFKYGATKMKAKQVEALGRKGQEDIATLVTKIYAELLSLNEQYNSEGKTLEFAEEYLRIKEKAFSEGMVPSSEVVDARLNLAKAKVERLQIAYKYDVTLAKLAELCGDNNLFSNH